MVEAAFAMPVILAFVMALIDFGMAAFQTGAAASAARDGARTAMLWPRDSAAVRTATVAHLAERATPTITTSCSSTCVAGTDRVTVTVSWPYRPATGGLFPVQTISATSTMTVVGSPLPASAPTTTTTTTTTVPSGGSTTVPPAPTTTTTTTTSPPTTTTAPGTCQVQSLVIDGAPFGPKSNDGLQGDMTFSLRTNGVLGCHSLAIRVDTGTGARGEVSLSGSGPVYTAEIGKNAHKWTDGPHTVQVLAGSTVIHTTTVDV
jgi:Flp pilus assembly protein TadG